MISYTHSKILKQKNFTGSGFEGAPKTYETLEFSTKAVFHPLI